MDEPVDGHTRRSLVRGPYGTNENDTWLGPDWMQEKLDEEGNGVVVCCAMIEKEGRVQECIYTTANPEMIREAREGHEKYVAELAARN
jgi:hypothetical protein